LSRNWQTDRNRWSYYWNHETRFDPAFYARTDIAKVSDAWYFKDFSSHNYYREHYTAGEDRRYKKVSFFGDESLASLTSTARVFKGWDRYSASLLGRYTDDFSKSSNAATLQTYPELTLTAARQPVFGTPLLWEMNTAYNYFYRSEGQKGHLYDMEPVLSLPLNLGPVLLTPEVGWKGTFWQRDDASTVSGSRQDERNLFAAGLGLSTELNRVYDVGGAKIEKIRHGIKPEATYQYITDPHQADLPDYVAALSGKNAVSYALTNTFTARLKDKDGKVTYLEMVRVKLAQTYDVKEARRDVADAADKRRPFSQMDLEADVNPTSYFSLAVRNTLNVYSGDWIRANYDAALRDKRGDAVTLGYHYTRDLVEEIDVSLKAILTKSLDVLYILRRNERDRRTLESTFGLSYHRQCWGVSLTYSESYDDRSFMLNVSLTGLGRFGG
jgi:LPS-assembly protein